MLELFHVEQDGTGFAARSLSLVFHVEHWSAPIFMLVCVFPHERIELSPGRELRAIRSGRAFHVERPSFEQSVTKFERPSVSRFNRISTEI